MTFVSIICGQRGCGKSEQMRIASGMTHDEFVKSTEEVDRVVEKARKRAEERRRLDLLLWWFYSDY